jgi:hypothetical protein
MVLFHTGSLLYSLLEFFLSSVVRVVAVRDWYLAERKELSVLELES